MDESTRARLIAETIRMIDERGAAASVSLREVARRSGCAAPNVYNHFSDLDGLLNAAHQAMMADFNERIPARLVAEPVGPDLLLAAARAFTEYALEHRGWFNCFFFESGGWRTSADTDSMASSVGAGMIGIVKATAASRGHALDDRRAAWLTRVIYSYLLGELAPVITGRSFAADADREDFVERLVNGCTSLFEALLNAPLPDRRLPEW